MLNAKENFKSSGVMKIRRRMVGTGCMMWNCFLAEYVHLLMGEGEERTSSHGAATYTVSPAMDFCTTR
uniref:Ovule protein n=1 Tax=Angiostrongylus cantonensis TaxID=6313 RepID=A0A0K0DH42_ANGCA